MRIRHGRALRTLAMAGVVCLSLSAPSLAATFNLRADVGSVTMPDGRVIQVWGFALGAGPVTVPGPQLVLPPGDTTLTINLTNNLSKPVSIVVPGLVRAPTALAPVYDGGTPPRVLSFDTEAAPTGGNAAYTFTNVRPGTFLYESGRDPAQQVQMGLYGAVIARPTIAGRAYNTAATAFSNEIVMLLSEIDPDFHDAVQNNCYAPNGPTDPGCATIVTSANNYVPRYFLINGAPYSDPYVPFSGGNTANVTLIRLLNAGLQTHTMTLQGTRMDIIGQDGNLLGFARTARVSEAIVAGQTLDILIRPTIVGKYAFFDRALGVTNAGVFPGGLIAFIDVVAAPNQAPNGTINTPSGNVTITAGQNVNFTASSNDPDNNTPLTYFWDMGGGATNRTVEDPGSTTFSTPGTYTVTFTVTDSLLLSDPTPDSRVITVNEPPACTGVLDVRVATGSDDAEQGGSTVTLGSGDIELVYDGTNQTVGLRFTNITIPQGTAIQNAYIQFQADEAQSGATTVTLQAQAIDNAPTFTTSSNNVSSRSRVGSVVWGPIPAWGTVGQAGVNQRTSDITTLIQAVVNRGGWASGNALAIIITGTGGSPTNHRTAESFEGTSAGAALLHIDYACVGGNQAPNGVINTPSGNVTITAGQSVNFTGTGTDPDNNTPLTFLWNMGGGATNRTVEDPGNVAFNTPGNFTVTFTVRDSLNQPDPTPASRVITVNPAAATLLDRRVAAGSDDAEQKGSIVDLGSSDIEVVYDGSLQTVGLRFTNITIPQGRTITNAYIQFQADEAQSGPTSATLYAQAAVNAATFTTASNNITSRTRVGSVAWNSIPAWGTIGEAGVNQRTPDIKSLIQAVVNQGSWASGNALVIIIDGTTGSSSNHRTGESFEGTPTGAALLHVEY